MFKRIVLIIVTISTLAFPQIKDFSSDMPNSFDVRKFVGNIDKYPITMLLTLYPDSSISGYYYYDNTEGLFRVTNNGSKKAIVLEACPIDPADQNKEYEIFEFTDCNIRYDKHLKGNWKYKNNILPFVLNLDSLANEWRLLQIKVNEHLNQYPYYIYTENYLTIFPSFISSESINNYFLKNIELITQPMINFINSDKSKYLLIERNSNTDLTESANICWSMEWTNELVYLSDSVITYKTNYFQVCNNGYGTDEFTSIRVSDGAILGINDIFKKDKIDNVLIFLKKKYKNVLPTEENAYKYDAPPPSYFNRKTNIYIAKGGIYFRQRYSKLGKYYNLFLNYKETNTFLSESFKKFIGF